MGEQTERELDQLWYTWSTSGLGPMRIGFRVRAASEGLYDTQGMRYRRIDRFLRYELPEGASISEFNTRIAPVSLTFVDNGEERLLIRKVFLSEGAGRRSSVFFTHVIAGLPREFTARDAIRLWYCPDLWVESEQGLSPNDTHLKKIPYSHLLSYVDRSQTNFNFTSISEPLQNLLLLVLSQGLPPRIHMRGHSTLIAALIYGLTHVLPLPLLPNLTFTTYESQEQESEVVIVGTISGAELHDIARVIVQPGKPTETISPDLQRYANVAVNALMSSTTAKLFKLIAELERRGHAGVEDLIELFKRRFRISPLTLKQLEDIILHPTNNLDDLLDPAFQTDAAQLLLSQPNYWEQRGKAVFERVVSWLTSGAQTRLDPHTREALGRCLNGIAQHILTATQAELIQGRIHQQGMMILAVLAHPSTNPGIYQRMLTEFAKEPLYVQITSDSLWSFHLWLLTCARLMQPQPTLETMQSWLHIPTWEKLDKVLKFGLPAEWEYVVMFEQLKREIPKSAIPVVKAHEAKFIAFMVDILQQGSQAGKQVFISAVLRLFRAIIHHDGQAQATKDNEPNYSYPNRVHLLLALLNAVPNNPGVIESLFSIVPLSSPYQLTMTEFDTVVAGCQPEVLATGGASPELMRYLNEYIFCLSPRKLNNQNTISLLKQFQGTASSLPGDIANLVNSWLAIHIFFANTSFDEDLLQKIKPALEYLVPQLQQRGQDIWRTFIEELIPYLCNLIITEYQLGSVLYVFESAKVVSSWDLLNAMATNAGATLSQDASRLTPYLLYGIREHAQASKPQDVLDRYLQALYGQVSEDVLTNVDAAASSGVWPESIRNEWKGWRERKIPSWRNNLPIFGRKTNPQQQRPPTGSQTVQLPVSQQNHPSTTSLPEQHPFAPVRSSTGQQSATKLPSSQKQVNAQAMNLQIIISIVGTPQYSIPYSHYQKIHHTFVQILPFWLQVLSNERRNEGRTQAIAYEDSMVRDLLENLQSQPATIISDKLIQYGFVDDILIELKGKQLFAKWSAIQNRLNADNYIKYRDEEFQKYIGQDTYQDLCEKYNEQTIDQVLKILIRRYHFILLMDDYKKNWEKWLRMERRHAKVEYQASKYEHRSLE